VILAHVFYNAPWVALAVAQSRRAMPQGQLDAAATLGAGAGSRFRWVVWPELRWALGAACAQVLALCTMSFALVLILGGGPPVETLETALYSRLRGGALDLGGAAACAAWELLLTLTPWALLLWLRGRMAGPAAQASVAPARGGRASWAWIAAAVLFLPYLAVFRGGVGPWFTAEFWAEAAIPLRLSIWIAMLSSGGALGIAALATVATSYAPARAQAWVGAGLAIPSGLSVLVLGLGGWLAYGRWIDPFEGSLLAIVGLQITVFFPVAFRMLWPLAQSTQKRELEAAWSLGASPWRAFWLVDWPRWRAPVFSALALVAGLALGEVAAVSLFYSEKLIPLPLLVSRWMAQYRFEDARAVSALLLTGAAGLMAAVSLAGRSAEAGRANAAGV
jgi:thiamine transport system permease protein